MSLIHWWPLNGDTRDYITDKSLTNKNATITDGKLGKAYYFNGSANLTQTLEETLDRTISVSYWIKLASTWSGWGQVFTIGNVGTSWNDIRFGTDINSEKNLYFSISNGSSNLGTNGPCQKLTSDTWYHISAIYDNEKLSLYVNGSLAADRSGVSTSIVPTFSSSTVMSIGGNSSELGECTMCDVRVYNHALSVAEIKELSKGLLIHYPFNQGTIESTTNVNTANWSTYSSYWTISSQTINSIKLYRHTGSTSTTVAIQNSNVTGKMASGETWTFSGYLYVDGKPYKTTCSNVSTTNYNFSAVSSISREDGYFESTIKLTGAPGAWVIHNTLFGSIGLNIECEIRGIQFEKKDHATTYITGSRTGFLENEAGYKGDITLSNISFKREESTRNSYINLNGTSSYIVSSSLADYNSGASASLWIKTDSYPTSNEVVFADGNSKLAFGFYNSTQAIIACAGSGQPTVTDLKSKWKTGWNHICITRNSSGSHSCYLNGEKLSASGSNEWTHGLTSCTIGCRYNGTYTTFFKGNIKDFRLYSTCLSDGDIYNLSSSSSLISNKGDLLTGEIIEGYRVPMATKEFLFKGEDFSEIGNTDFTFLNFIQSTGTQYIDTGYFWENEKAKIIADLEITSNSGSQTIFGNEEAVASGLSSLNRYFTHILHGSGGSFSHYIGAGSAGSGMKLSLNTRYVINYSTNGSKQFSSSFKNVASGAITTSNNNVSYSGSIITRRNTTTTNFSNIGHIFIFSNHNCSSGSGAIQNIGGMKLYRFTMYDGERLVRDYIPCKRNSDSKIGLFDLVTGTFSYSPNGAAFTAGSNLTLEQNAKIMKSAVFCREIIET